MSETKSKYWQYVYEFEPQHTNWGDWCHSPQAYFRGNTDIPGSNYNVGFQVFKKPVYLEREPHFHREEEYLIFMGVQRPNVFDFDAEIELWIGEDPENMEKHVITKPTIVRIPKCMWHCPLDFKRVDKPIFFQSALMHGDFGSVKKRIKPDGSEYYEYAGDGVRSCVFDHSKNCNYCGKCFAHFTAGEGKDPNAKDWRDEHHWEEGHKYDYLFHEFVPEYTKWGDWCPSPQAYFRGEECMPGSHYHVGFQMFTGPLPMEDAHFHQGVDEYLVFIGADFMNVFDWDAEIELWIGEHPDKMEKLVITKPSIVRIPPTLWHCPINFKVINKPIMFQAAFLDGVWGTITRRINDDGTAEYLYRGDNVRYCRENPEKKCNYCGKCFTHTPAE